MQSPMRDERETLERRLEALKSENEGLRKEVERLPPGGLRRFKPWGIVFLCLVAAPPAWFAGCYAGTAHPASHSDAWQ